MGSKNPSPMMAVNLTENIRKCKWAYYNARIIVKVQSTGKYQSSN